MSERGYKRKRSLQDSVIDISKTRTVLNHLETLNEELDGIEETEEELQNISDDVHALETILKRAKKPKVTFSTVTSEDLKKAGVMKKLLYFDRAKIQQLVEGITTSENAEISDLYSRLKKIYARVNMDYAAGSRMVLDAILLALAEIISDKDNQTSVAIFPGLRIAEGDGVPIAHPVSGYELRLSGCVHYAVIEYEDVEDYRDRLLTRGVSRDNTFKMAKNHLFLVEDTSPDRILVSCIPEAVSQAIALLKSTDLPEVRFCLSDGEVWMFFILDQKDGTPTYHESAPYLLSKSALKQSDMQLRQIMQLICEWLRPTVTGLFESR